MVTAVRTLLTFLIIVAVLVGALALYLHFTTPHETSAVAFPLGPDARAFVASVPASAEAFAYIPRAAALDARLRANPVTRDAIQHWSAQHLLPRPWMIGRADLLVWQSGGHTRYLLRIDPVRAMLVRTYLMVRGDVGDTILLNAPGEQSTAPEEIAKIDQLTAALPPGDALVVQRSGSRGAFPPIARPAVSSVRVTADELQIVSHADAGTAEGFGAPLNAKFARSALLTASFQSPPRLLDDLNRLFGAKVSGLLADGGTVALYDVDTGKLLPRPVGVIAVSRTEAHRAELESLVRTLSRGEVLGYRVRTAERADELVLSFDQSIDSYLKDATDSATIAAGHWAVHIDAQRLAPILGRVQDNLGLRIASPKLFRAARDLDRWIGGLEQAKMIEATDSAVGPIEELKVRITSK